MSRYALAVTAFALAFLGIGFALLARTALAGGGTAGYFLGALFVALGTARLVLLRRSGR